MSVDEYPIPDGTCEAETIVSRSRFIAVAGIAETVEEARALIAQQRLRFPDANHHVYAYRIGYGSSVTEGMSDDGEPSGTSAPPILALLRGTNIGDVIVVVTRYFGGTKLGTGGLTRAYRDSARAAIEILPRSRKIDFAFVDVELPYTFYKTLTLLLPTFEAMIAEETFAGQITLKIKLPRRYAQPLIDAVHDRSAGQITPTLLA